MLTKKIGNRGLRTDRNTDYLFNYFMNEDKVNEQLRNELDEKMEQMVEKMQRPQTNNKEKTEKKKDNESSEKEHQELPSNSSDTKTSVEFNDETEISEEIYSSEISIVDNIQSNNKEKTSYNPYKKKILNSSKKPVIIERKYKTESVIPNQEKKETVNKPRNETAEERRARSREAYAKLQSIEKKVDLFRKYTVDSDPDEMEHEYKIHKNAQSKTNKINFCKSMLLNIVCGIEFLNTNYNPFDFKLTDWSKQVASDMDDYTDIIEEICAKYSSGNGGFNFPPEVKLAFFIIFSGISFHISQLVIGSGGLNDAVQKNPNIIGKLLNGLLKPGDKSGGSVPENDGESKTKKILDNIRNKKNNSNITETQRDIVTENNTNDILLRKIEDLKNDYESKLSVQNDMFSHQLKQIQNDRDRIAQSLHAITSNKSDIYTASQVISDDNIKSSKYNKENQPIITEKSKGNLFYSENNNTEDCVDILVESLDDVSKSYRSSNKKSESVSNNSIHSNIKKTENKINTIISSGNKNKNKNIQSSTRRATENKSDMASISKRKRDNVIKI